MGLTRSVEQLERLRPRLILVAAAAGFGKTLLLDRAAERYERVLRGSLLHASDPAEVRRRLDPLLEGCETTSRGLLALDDAQSIADNAEALALLESRLARLPPSWTAAVASRRALSLRASRIAPPHQVLAFEAADLAMDAGDARALFPALGDDDAHAACERMHGWPVGLLFLARFPLSNKAIPKIADDPALAPLRQYVASEIIEACTPVQQLAILASGACNGASAEDLNAVLDAEPHEIIAPAFDELMRVCPFVRTERIFFRLEPLLAATVMEFFAARARETARAIAEAHESAKRYTAAARIHHALGNEASMVAALWRESDNPLRATNSQYNAFIASVDAEVLRRHPLLRILSVYHVRQVADAVTLARDIRAALLAITDKGGPEFRATLAGTAGQVFFEAGYLDDAEALLREAGDAFDLAADAATTSGHSYVLRTLGRVLVRKGKIEEAERLLTAGYVGQPLADRFESTYLLERMRVEWMRGARAAHVQLGVRALESATASGLLLNVATAYAETAYALWFWGDDEDLPSLAQALRTIVDANGYAGFSFLADAFAGRADAAPAGVEQPAWLARAWLVAAAGRRGKDRVDAVRAAAEAATRSNEPFIAVLAEVARAVLVPLERSEAFDRAFNLAANVETHVVHTGVSAVLEGHADRGIFGTFVRRLREGEAFGEMQIEILTQSISLRNAPAPVPEREAMLLVALAAEPGKTAEQLGDLLWESFDQAAARDALNSCLYRLRKRFGRDVIVHHNGTYRLSDAVEVDVREIERTHEVLRRVSELSPANRAMLRALAERLARAREPARQTWDFLRPAIERARAMRREIYVRLATEALERGWYDDAVDAADAMRADDPCDERACELAMRAYIAKGNRAAAGSTFEEYAQRVRTELGTSPSQTLRDLKP